MTKLEQVARAIEDEIAKLSDVRNIGGFYGEIARAAVEALRNPGEEIENAGDELDDWGVPSDPGSGNASALAHWHAMIDAILNEKPE